MASGVVGRRVVAAVVALMSAWLLLAAAPTTARAADGEGLQRIDLGATVTANFGRGAGAGSWTLVGIEFSPRVPIAGRVEVGGMGMTRGGAVHEVEVSAGATKVFHLLLPPSEDLQASFVASDGTRVTLPRPQQVGREDVLVGAIGAAPALPTPLNVAGLDRPINGVAVDPAVVDLGPRALDALDALVVPAADLAAMDDARRHTLAVAATSGLDLVVPVRAGDDALPLPWSPIDGTDAGAGGAAVLRPSPGAWTVDAADLDTGGGDGVLVAATNAGRGRVVALAQAPGEPGPLTDAGVWAELFQPRADLGMPLGSMDDGDLGNRLFGGTSTLPGIAGALVFLVVYLVLVGPVNALVVRRLGRRELTWVTVPAVTVVFTAVAALTAAGGGPSSTPVTRAAWWLDGVGQEVTALSLQAPSRGTHQVTFPGARDTMVGTFWNDVTSFNRFDGTDTTFSAHLEALQTTTAVAFGPASAPPPLDVTATYTDGVLEVNLANRAEVDLEDVRILAATASKELGTLPAGDDVTVTVDDLEATLPRPPGDQGLRMMGGMRGGQGNGEPPGPTAAERLLAWNVLDRSPGVVWVTAATRQDLGFTPPRLSGSVDDRGSFVAVGVTPAHDGATVLPHEVRRDLLRRGVFTPWRQHPLTVDGEMEVVLRFRLPASDTATALVSTLDQGGAVRAMDMGMMDPWGDGCFEVTRVDADGNQSEPEEQCGPEVACPPGSRECGGDEQRVEACFEDGSCQIAERVAVAQAPAPPQEGFEVYDRQQRGWVPAADVFGKDGRGDPARVVSPFGEVLVRARNVGFLPFGQRGLGMEGRA
ncbi:hypothetical protein [Egicoccus sp. AB-alg2]|uniref:hypothetical protein n=1 Tax=Egicoccus sp. AB-alg2 TaxID=3242693 RepID=UPI00359E4594